MMMPKSLESLAQRRVQITDRIAALTDLRCGSITSTTGRCGKPNCRCHQPKAPGHGPNLRLTYKLHGKTVTESLPHPVAVRKAEREIEEFRKRTSGSRLTPPPDRHFRDAHPPPRRGCRRLKRNRFIGYTEAAFAE